MLLPDAHYAALLGDQLGTGSSRLAYSHISNPNVVIKKYRHTGRPPMSNLTEWFIWTAIVGTPLSSLFGECFEISETGKYLVMERLRDITPEDAGIVRPQVPMWLEDYTSKAFGVSATGTFKCRDYGLVKIGETLNRAPSKKVTW